MGANKFTGKFVFYPIPIFPYAAGGQVVNERTNGLLRVRGENGEILGAGEVHKNSVFLTVEPDEGKKILAELKLIEANYVKERQKLIDQVREQVEGVFVVRGVPIVRD